MLEKLSEIGFDITYVITGKYVMINKLTDKETRIVKSYSRIPAGAQKAIDNLLDAFDL